MKYCKSCGKELSDDSRFCDKCGKEVEHQTVSDNQFSVPADELHEKLQDPAPKKKRVSGLSIVGFVFSILLAPIGLILCIIDVAGRNRRKWLSIIGIVLSVIIVAFIGIPMFSDDAKPKASIEEYRESGIALKYDSVARYPDRHKGGMVKITGTIIQVQEGSSYNVYRIAQDDDYDCVYIVKYTPEEGAPRFLEDDVVLVYGIFLGNKTYESILGADITVPAIDAEYMFIKSRK